MLPLIRTIWALEGLLYLRGRGRVPFLFFFVGVKVRYPQYKRVGLSCRDLVLNRLGSTQRLKGWKRHLVCKPTNKVRLHLIFDCDFRLPVLAIDAGESRYSARLVEAIGACSFAVWYFIAFMATERCLHKQTCRFVILKQMRSCRQKCLSYHCPHLRTQTS